MFQSQSLASEYELQKGLLEKFHRRKGIDIFVSSCKVLQRAGESAFTMCTWTEGVSSLLPKTDVVVRVRLDGSGKLRESLLLEWGELADKTGALTLLDATYPPRYRTGEFPSQALRETLTPIAL
ncbi:hypothetical protein [Massilia aquatica]|uniref:Uncharacterized protein n=1 Tax=Massilia aquatica TaxID=2609000 RepID=A0ABX0MA10_9BURK|nr:hypothetical protein [Massilia aquatica]NHZ43842.1 hypothetical protein [Massilia aquatica]